MSLIKWSLHLKLPPLSSWVVHLKHCLQLDIPYSLSFSSGHYFLLLTLVEFDSNYIMAGQRIVWEEEGIMYVHEQIEGPNEEMIELVSEWMGVKEPHEKQDRGREERKQRERGRGEEKEIQSRKEWSDTPRDIPREPAMKASMSALCCLLSCGDSWNISCAIMSCWRCKTHNNEIKLLYCTVCNIIPFNQTYKLFPKNN